MFALQIDRIEGLHEWALCPYTVRTPRMSVMRYAHSFELAATVDIPGSLPPATTTTALPRVLILLRHWYDVILKMHRAGYSLRGEFCEDNFVILNYESSSPEVRLTGSICLSTYNKDIGSMDYYFLSCSMRRFFGVRGEVPHHIGGWLHFIDRGVHGDEYAIRCHPALMEPRQAFRSTMSLRRIFERIHRTDIGLYLMIMYWGRHLRWNFNRRCVNLLMDDARRHSLRNRNRAPGAPGPFEPNLRGMLKLIRDLP